MTTIRYHLFAVVLTALSIGCGGGPPGEGQLETSRDNLKHGNRDGTPVTPTPVTPTCPPGVQPYFGLREVTAAGSPTTQIGIRYFPCAAIDVYRELTPADATITQTGVNAAQISSTWVVTRGGPDYGNAVFTFTCIADFCKGMTAEVTFTNPDPNAPPPPPDPQDQWG
jgi:hypothetical protein